MILETLVYLPFNHSMWLLTEESPVSAPGWDAVGIINISLCHILKFSLFLVCPVDQSVNVDCGCILNCE